MKEDLGRMYGVAIMAFLLLLSVCPEIRFMIHDLSRRLAEWCSSIPRAMHLVPD